MRYDAYCLTDKATGSETRLTVPAGTHNHKLLWGDEHKIENTQKNIKLLESKKR